MSSRLPTSSLSRSDSSSIVTRNSWRASRCPFDVLLEQARHRRLDSRERRAQVVRDGREDRCAKVARGGEDSRPRMPPPGAPRARARTRSRGRTRRGSGCPRSDSIARPMMRAHGGRRARPASVAGSSGTGAPVGVVERPAGRLGGTRPGVERENPPQAVQENGHRRRTCQAGERLGLGARPRPVGCAPRSERDEGAHDRGNGEEDREGEQVLALLDRERVDRRSEVPVDEQKPDHGRGEGGPHAADGRDHDDEQQEQQQHAGEPEIGAEVREEPREQRQADGREHEAEHHAPPRQCAGAARPRDRGLRAVARPG